MDQIQQKEWVSNLLWLIKWPHHTWIIKLPAAIFHRISVPRTWQPTWYMSYFLSCEHIELLISNASLWSVICKHENIHKIQSWIQSYRVAFFTTNIPEYLPKIPDLWVCHMCYLCIKPIYSHTQNMFIDIIFHTVLE